MESIKKKVPALVECLGDIPIHYGNISEELDGYYSYHKKYIRISDRQEVDVNTTLAHELLHAIFDRGGLRHMLGDDGDSGASALEEAIISAAENLFNKELFILNPKKVKSWKTVTFRKKRRKA